MFRSGTQQYVCMTVTEAKLSTSVIYVQDMLYVMWVLQSWELKVKLYMLLKMDNKEVVDLANNWSVGGHKKHIDFKQYCYKSNMFHEIRTMHSQETCINVLWNPPVWQAW